eukprot:3266750-Rhodomonas_salina.1
MVLPGGPHHELVAHSQRRVAGCGVLRTVFSLAAKACLCKSHHRKRDQEPPHPGPCPPPASAAIVVSFPPPLLARSARGRWMSDIAQEKGSKGLKRASGLLALLCGGTREEHRRRCTAARCHATAAPARPVST